MRWVLESRETQRRIRSVATLFSIKHSPPLPRTAAAVQHRLLSLYLQHLCAVPMNYCVCCLLLSRVVTELSSIRVSFSGGSLRCLTGDIASRKLRRPLKQRSRKSNSERKKKRKQREREQLTRKQKKRKENGREAYGSGTKSSHFSAIRPKYIMADISGSLNTTSLSFFSPSFLRSLTTKKKKTEKGNVCKNRTST